MVLNYILVGVPAQGSKQTVKLKKYFTKVSREGLLFDFNLQYQSIYATFKLLAQFSSLSPLKWNNKYSRVIQEKKHQKLANLWRKMYFSPLHFNAGRKLVIFKCPTQPKPQICYLFLTQ